jgi:hypothetical protein
MVVDDYSDLQLVKAVRRQAWRHCVIQGAEKSAPQLVAQSMAVHHRWNDSLESH